MGYKHTSNNNLHHLGTDYLPSLKMKKVISLTWYLYNTVFCHKFISVKNSHCIFYFTLLTNVADSDRIRVTGGTGKVETRLSIWTANEALEKQIELQMVDYIRLVLYLIVYLSSSVSVWSEGS